MPGIILKSDTAEIITVNWIGTGNGGTGNQTLEPLEPLEHLEPIGYDPVSLSTERKYRPVERYWPYVEKPEEPTAEELAALDPDLHTTLFGPRELPFSITLVFPRFDGENFDKAVAKAKASQEFIETGAGADHRYRARFFSSDALQLRDLFEIVGPVPGTEVLIDDRPVPYSKELWLPLLWFHLLG